MIEQELTKLELTKAAIKLAITDKGVTNVGDVFSTYPDKIKEIQSGGSGVGLDFSKLNCTEVPKYLKDGYDTALQIVKNWDPAANHNLEFHRRKDITIAPSLISTNSIDQNAVEGLFRRCDLIISAGDYDFSNTLSVWLLFDSCTYIRSVGSIKCQNAEYVNKCFGSCTFLEYVKELVVGKCTSISSTFSGCINLRYVVVKNIGALNDFNEFKVLDSHVWGVNNDIYPDARQSLIDTLITYSTDRVAKGFTTVCNVILSPETKAVLTQDEIAQITAKGYTIA